VITGGGYTSTDGKNRGISQTNTSNAMPIFGGNGQFITEQIVTDYGHGVKRTEEKNWQTTEGLGNGTLLSSTNKVSVYAPKPIPGNIISQPHSSVSVHSKNVVSTTNSGRRVSDAGSALNQQGSRKYSGSILNQSDVSSRKNSDGFYVV